MTNITPDDAQDPMRSATADRAGQTTSPKQMLGDAAQAVKQEAANFASTAQERARGAVDRRKETATRTLGDVATAIRRAGEELDQRDQSVVSRMVHQTADTIENLTQTLADKGPDELLDTVRDFGRRQPLAFIGGAVLIGLAIGRFARASAQNEQVQGLSSARVGDGGGDWTSNEGLAGASAAADMGGVAGEGGPTEAGPQFSRDDIGGASLGAGSGGLIGEDAGDIGESDIERADAGTGEGRGRAAGYGNPEA